jgi:nucleotide-binding universal stress UspA family protein
VSPNSLLVGVDGSEGSAIAVRWAAELAAPLGASVVAVHALGLIAHLDPEGPAVPVESHVDEIDARCRSVWCAPLADMDVAHRPELRFGPPARVILDVADELDVDLIVVGSRGLGGFPELLLGSTSSQVAQHSTRPVAIIPGPGTIASSS